MPYPSGSDFLEHLKKLGIVDESEAMDDYYNDVMSEVIADFEHDTGWKPFLYEGDFEEKLFTLKNNRAFVIPYGAIEIEHVKYDGELLTEEEDYIVEPANETPKRRLLFSRYLPIIKDALEIKMKQGYTDTLTPDVRSALLDKAIVRYYIDRQGNGGDLSSVKQGEVAYSFGNKEGISANDRRLLNYGRVTARYRRYLYA